MSLSAENSSVEPSRHGQSTVLTPSKVTEQDTAGKYTTPTIFVCVSQGFNKPYVSKCRFWPSVIPQSYERKLFQYGDKCRDEARDTLKQYSKSRDADSQKMLGTVQSTLNDIHPTSEGFNVIAVDSHTFEPACARFVKAMDKERRKTPFSGLVVLGVEEPSQSPSRLQRPFHKVADLLDSTASRGTITDCKVYCNQTYEGSKEEASKELHGIGSDILARMSREGPLTDEMVVDALKGHPSCRSIRLPKSFADLPIFYKVNSGEISHERASTAVSLAGEDGWDELKDLSALDGEVLLAGKFPAKDIPDRSEWKVAATSEVFSDKEKYW